MRPDIEVEGLVRREIDGHVGIVVAGQGADHRAVEENAGVDQAAHRRDVLVTVGESDGTQDVVEIQGRGHATDADFQDVLERAGPCCFSAPIRPGDLYLTDYAQPSQVRRLEHCTAGIMLSRQAVRDAVGDVAVMAGIKFGTIGLAAVLRRHVSTTFDEASVMSSAERLVALKAAVDMTLALMRISSDRAADVEQFDSGFYRAAHVVIERDCGDPDLRPERVAMILGCSHASLYRAFARRDESVAAVIWRARTGRAGPADVGRRRRPPGPGHRAAVGIS